MTSSPSIEEAEAVLSAMAESFLATAAAWNRPTERNPQAQALTRKALDYEARYKALVDHVPAVIFVAPMEYGNGEAYVSPQIEQILGFTQEEWLGDPLRWYQQVHPDDKHRWSLEAASLFSSGKPLSSTYRVMARNGQVVWFQCDARMVHSSDGKPSFIHGIAFDVSQLKEAERSLKAARDELESRVEERTKELETSNARLKAEIAQHQQTELQLLKAKDAAEEAARIKSEFLANMSHEIRTPMNGVLGLTHLVLQTDLRADQQEYLSMAYTSAQSLLGIIDQVLDFSKVEAGKAQLHVANFSLRRCVHAVIEKMTNDAENKGLELKLRIGLDLPDDLNGDAGRLAQVLVNLIGNAIKFTQTGWVLIEVGLAAPICQTEGYSCVARFSITDTGIGIAADKLGMIFRAFEQADGSFTRKYGGTGLGLAIAKDLAVMMGGDLMVQSELGRGTTFTFTSRFEIAEEEAPTTTSPSQQLKSEEKARLRILVAEDNPVNQKVVKGVMQRFGHQVIVTGNGEEAVRAFSEQPFDLILMDVQMPVLDGLSAARTIRSIEARRPGTPHIPILALTAHALAADRVRCLAAGMDGYLSKPFKAGELMALVEDLVGAAKKSG